MPIIHINLSIVNKLKCDSSTLYSKLCNRFVFVAFTSRCRSNKQVFAFSCRSVANSFSFRNASDRLLSSAGLSLPHFRASHISVSNHACAQHAFINEKLVNLTSLNDLYILDV